VRVEQRTGGGDRSVNLMTVRVGEKVELECLTTGTTLPVQWDKIGQQLSPSAIIGNNILILPEVRPEDAGLYRCTAMNAAGSYQQVVQLEVLAAPIIDIQSDTVSTAALGTPAELYCPATGTPPPTITWVKTNGQLPPEHTLSPEGTLYIPVVTQEDGGQYQCVAENQWGRKQVPVQLVVGPLVPYFPQEPNSYIEYQPLKDSYLNFDIEMSFRPEVTDGLVLYNGYLSDQPSVGDFVCFGLNGAIPEFKFDAGAGTAVVSGDQPLEMNKWHTVKISKEKKIGKLMVNNQTYETEMPGNMMGMNLAAPMYLGGHPNIDNLPRSAGFSSGFVGGISELKIKGVDVNLGGEARKLEDVRPYQVCRYADCRNGANCLPANNRVGFVCQCAQGFAGARCEREGRSCHTGACGPEGSCYNRKVGDGYYCSCPMGYTGDGCRTAIQIKDPSFNSSMSSFIAYNNLENLKNNRINLMIKPTSLEDGILLYNAQHADGKKDFISLSIKDRHIEFRFDAGKGVALMKSRDSIQLNQWIRILANRDGNEGVLIVDNKEGVKADDIPHPEETNYHFDREDINRGQSPPGLIGLNLKRPLYLGGIDPREEVSLGVGLDKDKGFTGCIGEFTVDTVDIKLIDDALFGMNLKDCDDRKLCARMPCKNNATCENLAATEYRCHCPPQFTGDRCETEVNICVEREPCLNNGMCVVTGDGTTFDCKCAMGWMGPRCESRLKIDTSASFMSDSYAEFPHGLWKHRRQTRPEMLILSLKTTKPDGLVMWQGAKHEEGGRASSKDYLAMYLKDGYLHYRWELGSGAGEVKSRRRINDGFFHDVKVTRVGEKVTMIVDAGAAVKGSSAGPLRVLNVHGNIFFAGVPDFNKFTDNMFDEHFEGCISNLKFENMSTANFGVDAMGGMNVQPCLDSD